MNKSDFQEYIRTVIEEYMHKHDLSFYSVNASMNIAKTKVILSTVEEENKDPLDDLL